MNDQDTPQHEQLPDAPDFISELTDLINKHSMENSSNTPDFILARFLQMCLGAWNVNLQHRDKWYGFKPFEQVEDNDLGKTGPEVQS